MTETTISKSENWILFNGDADRIIPEHISNDSIDLCFTSPTPYNYGNQSIGIGSEKKVQDYIMNLVHLFANVKYILKDTGNLFVHLADPFSIDLGGLLFIPERIALTMLTVGWICKGKFIWDRTTSWEYIYWFAKGKDSYVDKDSYVLSQVFDYETVKGFPTEIIESIVIIFCPKDGVVLDPLCSSGGTGEVALDLKRKFIGIEIIEEKFKQGTINLSKW